MYGIRQLFGNSIQNTDNGKIRINKSLCTNSKEDSFTSNVNLKSNLCYVREDMKYHKVT